MTNLAPVLSIAMALSLVTLAKGEETRFSDDFDRAEIGDAWTRHANSFSIEAGVLVASQLPDAGHGAVIRSQWNFKDAIFDFDFKFEGGVRFNFVVDDKNCEEVHAGHICRVSIYPNRVTVQDDRTGPMNLELRELRSDPAHKARVERIFDSKRDSAKFEFEQGRWYRMKVVIEGDRMSASIDGKEVVGLESEGFAHSTKTQFGFTTTGQDILFDNVVAVGLSAND